jgi:hypothetical protein
LLKRVILSHTLGYGPAQKAPDEPSTHAVLNTLRDDAGRAGVNSVKGEMAKIDIIRKLELPANLFDHARPHGWNFIGNGSPWRRRTS